MSESGEVQLLLNQIRTLSGELMSQLLTLDGKLATLQTEMTKSSPDTEELLLELRRARELLGAMEKEENQELRAEEITQSILGKLNELIEKCIR